MSKSRGDRGKTPNSNQNAAHAPQNAIIPGKFMESEWIHLVEKENGDDFVHDVLNDIISAACNQIFHNIVDSRVQPYSVLSVKRLLLQLLEWRFIESDIGENENALKTAWVKDSEPLACVTDSWAQGAVPVVIRQQRSEMNNEGIDILKVHSPTDPCDEQNKCSSAESATSDREEDVANISEVQHKDVEETYNVTSSVATITPQPPKTKEKKFTKHRKNFKPYGGSVPNFEVISLTPVTDERLQPSAFINATSFDTSHRIPRDPSCRDAIFDENGNLVHVPKINFSKLPRTRVKTKYSIEDPINENTKKIQLLTRKNKHIKHQQMLEKEDLLVKKNMIHTGPLLQRLYSSSEMLVANDVMDSLYTPLPPSIVDTISISRGVSIREGGLSKQGPKKKSFNEESFKSGNHELMSLGSGTTRILEVKEIVSATSVKSLNMNTPLPSIRT